MLPSSKAYAGHDDFHGPCICKCNLKEVIPCSFAKYGISPTCSSVPRIEAARSRSQVVLRTMVRNGFITSDMASTVDPANVQIQPSTKQNSVRYFTDWALPQLDTLIDQTQDPIDVWTTLDPGMQVAADKAIRANAPDGTQGALVAIDRDGAVRAMVGGKDYVASIYNRATQAQRQPDRMRAADDRAGGEVARVLERLLAGGRRHAV